MVVAMTLQALSPLAQAMQMPAAAPVAPPDANDQYARLLRGLSASLPPADANANTARARAAQGEAAPNYRDRIEQFEYLYGQIAARQQTLLELWRAKGVDAEIIARETELQAAMAERHRRLVALLQQTAQPAARTAQGGSATTALAAFLADQVVEPRTNPLDPNQLPWQSPLADLEKLRVPYGETEAASPADKAPAQRTVQRKTPASTGAHDLPDAFDLAPTGDAPHTPAIQALAASLGNNPLAIYQWVHDNIVFTPTYGSVQGAQDTLDKRSGNAFDQASLLIALLRSAGISARYVVGTIEVPEDKLRNWLGDYKTIDAAQQILGQGGIPNVAMVRGGRVDALRLEHAWVEAHLSFYPSRGARHIPGVSQGDTWVPMDPSYKQYTYTAGVDLGQQVSFDAQAFADAARIGASIDDTQGWVQNLNQSNIERDLNAYQERLKTHVDSRYPNATVGDILGTQKIIPDTAPYFAGTLKTTITATAARYSALPDSLRAQFRYRLFLDAWSASMDSPELTFQQPTSELAGKKLTLAWVPASDADRQAIEALLPAPNPDGSPIRPDQLPQGLPGSINLKAEIRLEGTPVATSRPYRAGAEPVGMGGYTRYASLGLQGGADWDDSTDALVAGQQSAIGLSIQGISKTQLETLKTRMEATKTKLQQVQANPGNTQPLDDLTGDILAGDLLTANIWSWWAEHQSHGRISAAQSRLTTQDPHNTWQRDTSGMEDRPALGYGMFHSVAVPTKLYGTVTTGVRFKGVMMDISHMRAIRWVKDSRLPQNAATGATAQTEAKNRWIAYNRMRGQYASALEHAIPERFFNDPATCNAPGASATT
ncbi:MAG: transglutaminase domain-containing protein, partial [Rhodocyclales bacterium]|nr:transglutaminase domain-containing protein [Rhodocyclales bacterium]